MQYIVILGLACALAACGGNGGGGGGGDSDQKTDTDAADSDPVTDDVTDVGECSPGETGCCEQYADGAVGLASSVVFEGCYGTDCDEQAGVHGPRVAIGICACNVDGEWYLSSACPDCLTTSQFQVAHCEACSNGPTCAVIDGCALNCE